MVVQRVFHISREELLVMNETEFGEYLDASLRILGVDPEAQRHITAEIPPVEQQGEATESEKALLRSFGWDV